MKLFYSVIMTLTIISAVHAEESIQHVVLISFDGLRPDAITILGSSKAPGFNQLVKEGASTLNARTDYDYTVTIPNHTCMLTGYPVMGPQGHGVTENNMVEKTTHDFAGRHVASIFDVLREHKRTSAMLVSKAKFNIFSRSYPIDVVAINDYDDLKTLEVFEKLSQEGLPNFVFMHFSGTDRVGHKEGWDVTPGSAYMNQVELLDGYLLRVIKAINTNSDLKESTVFIVTTDHGGEDKGHSDKANSKNYTIPFIIWGKAVDKGIDLYTINHSRRRDPSDQRISYQQNPQPIRNGDAVNLALSLLGLPVVEGSTIGHDQPLKMNKD